MNQRNLLILLLAQSVALEFGCASAVMAQSFRIPRPGQTDSQGASTQTTRIDTLKANASINDDMQSSKTSANGTPLQASAVSMNAIFDWQNRFMPRLQAQDNATMGNAIALKHHGLKSHIVGGAFDVIGAAAHSYVPMHSAGIKGAPPDALVPTITIQTAHCPAAVDPAFQSPPTWWRDLSGEENSPDFGPQWQLWLGAVKAVFQAHALELRQTPGVAALHIIVNPDGSIVDISPYSGAERTHSGYAINYETMGHLRQIILNVGKFPPFPLGTKVGRYHMVFDGAAS